MSRCSRDHDVVFFEDPMFDTKDPDLELRTEDGIRIAVPHLPLTVTLEAAELAQRRMIDRLLYELDNPRPVLWYYSPMALAFTNHVKAKAIVYDCMDELSLFHGTPSDFREREDQLLEQADAVFTGGHSPYSYKRDRWSHRNIHAFSSKVDEESVKPIGFFGRAILADDAWDRTWTEMWEHVERAIATRTALRSSGVLPIVRPGAGGASELAVRRASKAR